MKYEKQYLSDTAEERMEILIMKNKLMKLLMLFALLCSMLFAACDKGTIEKEANSSNPTKDVSSSAKKESKSDKDEKNAKDDTIEYTDENGFYIEEIYKDGLLMYRYTYRQLGMPPFMEEDFKYDGNVLISSDLLSLSYDNDYFEGGASLSTLVKTTEYYPNGKEYRITEYEKSPKGGFVAKIVTEYGTGYPENVNDKVVTEYSRDTETDEVREEYISDYRIGMYTYNTFDGGLVSVSSEYLFTDNPNDRTLVKTTYYNSDGNGGNYIYMTQEYDELERLTKTFSYNEQEKMLYGTGYEYFEGSSDIKKQLNYNSEYIDNIESVSEFNEKGSQTKFFYYYHDGTLSHSIEREYFADGITLKHYTYSSTYGETFHKETETDYYENGLTKNNIYYDTLGKETSRAYYEYYDNGQYSYSEERGADGYCHKTWCNPNGSTEKTETSSDGIYTIYEYTYYDDETYAKTFTYKTCTQKQGPIDSLTIRTYCERDELGRDTITEFYDELGTLGQRDVVSYWEDTQYRKEAYIYDKVGSSHLYLHDYYKYDANGNVKLFKWYNPDGTLGDQINY